MKFVFVSESGDSIPIAMKVADEGHNVVFMISDEMFRSARVGEGLITLGPRPTLDAIVGESPDCVVFDMVGFGEIAGALKAQNIPVFGASLWADVMELKRGYAFAVMAAAGISTPPTKTFASAQEALKWVSTHKERYVLKPSDNLSTSMTYVSKTPEDCVGMLERFVDMGVGEISLQEVVEGIEVSCEGWFNGESFVEPFNITFEEKRFLEGGLGPNTGCMGNVVIPLKGRPKLVREGIGRMEKILKASDYRGPIDLNSIVSMDGHLYGLEFTVRFGYDAIQALLEGLDKSARVSDLLFGVATGKLTQMRIVHNYMIAVRLTVQPYPQPAGSTVVNVPVFGINDQNAKHLWPSGLRVEKGKFVGCSPDGNLLVATAWGDTLLTAKQRVYRTVGNLIIPDVQYRRDIGARVERSLQQLQAGGWL